jgi:GAF domain
MIDRFIGIFKNPARLSLLLTFFFFVGILCTAYVLYTLPQQMMWSQAIHILDMNMARSVFITPALAMIFTFLMAIAAIAVALKSKKETIVYLEKKKGDLTTSHAGSESGSTDSADVASFRISIQQVNEQKEILQKGLNFICKQFEVGQGAIYLTAEEEGKRTLELKSGYALSMGESQTVRFEFGEGLIGQVASSGKNIYLDEVPEGYIKIVSGLGTASPRYLFIAPLKREGEVKGVMEIATFSALNERVRVQMEEMGQILASKIG